MAKLKFDIMRSFSDPRDMPAYSIPLAALYLRVPVTTLRYWVLGRSRPTRALPVIARPDPTRPLLSFFNLAEAHVLRAFRKEHHLPLPHIRTALDYLGDKFGTVRPLIEYRFKTDGVSLFIEELEKLIDVSEFGQMVIPELMGHLERLEFKDNVVARLYPFTRLREPGPKSIFIDPRYSFGRPVLASIKVPTGIIVERYKAGESVDDLAKDYGCKGLDIQEAIRCELFLEKAA